MSTPMDILKQAGTITGLFQKEIELGEPFIDFAMRFGHIPGTTTLMSGTDLDCARYHMLATRPFLTFSGKGRVMTICSAAAKEQVEADPFDMLRQILCHFKAPDIVFPEPVSAGLFGYLAYDLKNHIESLPKTTMDRLDLPEIYMAAPSLMVVQDKNKDKTQIFIPELSTTGESGVADTLDFFNRIRTARGSADEPFSGSQTLHSNFDKPSYMAAIHKIRDYITAGDIYQVNMSQRFDTQFSGSPSHLVQSALQKKSRPFFCFNKCGRPLYSIHIPGTVYQTSGKFCGDPAHQGDLPPGDGPGPGPGQPGPAGSKCQG